jgi:ribosomal-protein-serine acetyltransferase
VHTAPDELTAGPVVLRRWRAQDAGVLYRVVSESLEHLAPWMAWAAHGYSTTDAAVYIARADEVWGTEFSYAILAPANAPAGGCSLVGRDGSGAVFEIGYWVHPRDTGRGYATAAAAALTAEAFRIGAGRVEIVHDAANVPSGSIPRRLGFTEVARRRRAAERTGGEPGVDVVWGLRRPGSG